MKPIILQDITKIYGERRVLDKINLEIDNGEMIAIVGESGSGKSTLLNILGLLETKDEGQLFIKGNKINKINTSLVKALLRNDIGYVFQNFGLIDNETVYHNLNLVLKYKAVSNNKEMIANSLKAVGLEGVEKNIVATLSGGEQQRIAIARLMLKDPSIVLCDEPTGSLDNENKEMVMELIESLRTEDRIIIIVTHDMDIAERCDCIFRLY